MDLAWADVYSITADEHDDNISHSKDKQKEVEQGEQTTILDIKNASTSLSSSLPNESHFLNRANLSNSLKEKSFLMKSMGALNDENDSSSTDDIITDFYLAPYPEDYDVHDISSEISKNTKRDKGGHFVRDFKPRNIELYPETIQRKAIVEKLTPPAFLPTYSKPRKPENIINKRSVPSSSKNVETKFTRDDQISFRRLLDITMDHYMVDLPVCTECGYDLYEQIICEIEDVEDDIETYEKILAKNDEEDIQSQMNQIEETLRRTKVSRKHYLKQLDEVLDARKQMCYNVKKLMKGDFQLGDIDKRFWKKYGDWKVETNSFFEEVLSTQNELVKSKQKLSFLRSSNALNDSFHIWAEGHFGTVNDLRIDRKSVV